MHPEDELDALLTSRRAGQTQRIPLGHPVSQEVEPLLDAATHLDAFRDAAPSAAFAADLEARLMAHMAHMAGATDSEPAQRKAAPRQQVKSRLTSPFVAWGAIAAALALTIGMGVFTAQAAPGGPLYGVRQFAQHLAAQALPSPTVDPLTVLAKARADLATYNAEIASGNIPAARATLTKLRDDDAHVAQGIATLSDATAKQTAQTQLSDFRQGAQSDLRASLAAMNWQGRAQVTDVLRSWGDASLVVTRASVTPDTSTSNQGAQPSNGGGDTVLLVVEGAGFTQGAQLILNGQPVGTLVSLTPTQFTARVSASALDEDHLAIGVEATDGTLAYTTSVQRDDHGGPDHSGTPGAGGDHSGDHGGSTGSGADATPHPEGTTTVTLTPSADETPSPTVTPSGH